MINLSALIKTQKAIQALETEITQQKKTLTLSRMAIGQQLEETPEIWFLLPSISLIVGACLPNSTFRYGAKKSGQIMLSLALNWAAAAAHENAS